MLIPTDKAMLVATTTQSLRNVDLKKVEAISDLKTKLATYITIQNQLFSYLTLDPTQFQTFFHLAGVTHHLLRDLLEKYDGTSETSVFPSQESWFQKQKRTLEIIVKHTQDFEDPKLLPLKKNIEALYQDILYLEQKISRSK